MNRPASRGICALLAATAAASAAPAAAQPLAVATSTSAVMVMGKEPEPDPLRYALHASVIEGAWSILLTVAWALSSRGYDAPYPDGIAGIATARVLYGTSWSILLATEVAIARAIAGDHWGNMSRGRFTDTWLVGLDVPARCGARARPCGLGLGSFGEVSALVTRDPLPIRAALISGWIQGRFEDDERRTLIESTWIQSPISILAELPLEVGPIALTLVAGPGLYWGLHNAHVHAHPRFHAEVGAPIHELIFLDGGLGPGVHASASLSFFDLISLEADGELAPLLLGGSDDQPIEAARAAREATRPTNALLTWRRISFGLGLKIPAFDPLRIILRAWAAELSKGPIDRLGHRALGIEFGIPIELDPDDVED